MSKVRKPMKRLVFNEGLSKFVAEDVNIKTTSGPKGHVVVKNLLGETIYEGLNKVVIAGSAFTASKHFKISAEAMTPSYNEILGLEHTIKEPAPNGVRDDEKVYLFAVGMDGCGPTPKEVYPVNYTSWISPDGLIPFRYQPVNNDLTPADRKKYFGRKLIERDGRIAYYFKKFESISDTIQQRYLDGTPIDENVYTSERTDEVETFVRMHLILNREDCRDFFNLTVGQEESRVSSLSILTAWKKNINGIDYYQDIRPLTKFHFPVESLIDNSKGLDITYTLYY